MTTLKVDTDKAWDAIHRCLTDGTLEPDGGAYTLSHAVLGGRHLHEDYYVVYVSADQVHDVAQALHGVDEEWLRARFDAIDDPEYPGGPRRRGLHLHLEQLRRRKGLLRPSRRSGTSGDLHFHLAMDAHRRARAAPRLVNALSCR